MRSKWCLRWKRYRLSSCLLSCFVFFLFSLSQPFDLAHMTASVGLLRGLCSHEICLMQLIGLTGKLLIKRMYTMSWWKEGRFYTSLKHVLSGCPLDHRHGDGTAHQTVFLNRTFCQWDGTKLVHYWVLISPSLLLKDRHFFPTVLGICV